MDILKVHVSIFLLHVCVCHADQNLKEKQCIRSDDQGCSCRFTDGSGVVNLTSLGNTDDTPRFKDVIGVDGLLYSYNPCYGFKHEDCVNASTCVKQDGQTEQLGDADSGEFQYIPERSSVFAVYSRKTFGKVSMVELVCDPNAREPFFQPYGAMSPGFYSFRLTTACACAGKC